MAGEGLLVGGDDEGVRAGLGADGTLSDVPRADGAGRTALARAVICERVWARSPGRRSALDDVDGDSAGPSSCHGVVGA